MTREQYISMLINDIKDTNLFLVVIQLERKGYKCLSWGLNEIIDSERRDTYLIEDDAILSVYNCSNKERYAVLEVDDILYNI